MKPILKILNYITSLGGKAPIVLTRLLRYACSSFFAVGVDYTLLLFFVEILNFYYLSSAGVAFVIAHSVNYLINRIWGFKGTRTHIMRGYLFFIFFGVLGLFLTIPLLKFFVEYLNIFYFVARVFVTIIVGIVDFTLNYFITFQMRKIDFKKV